jgi:DNA-binding transcriptional ArsR family regulator
VAALRTENSRSCKRSPSISITRWASLLKVLGHPVRLRIVRLLGEERCNVSSIWSRLDLQQSVASQHLAILRKCGVVGCERSGTSVVYFVTNRWAKAIVAKIDEDDS